MTGGGSGVAGGSVGLMGTAVSFSIGFITVGMGVDMMGGSGKGIKVITAVGVNFGGFSESSIGGAVVGVMVVVTVI